EAVEERAANASLIKVNQIGTVTETLEAIRVSREAGHAHMVSHRNGETEDAFIAGVAGVAGKGVYRLLRRGTATGPASLEAPRRTTTFSTPSPLPGLARRVTKPARSFGGAAHRATLRTARGPRALHGANPSRQGAKAGPSAGWLPPRPCGGTL